MFVAVMRSVVLAVAALALCLCAAAPASVSAVRGVRRADEALYSGATFTCRDGSKTVDSSYVNDEYCDCSSDGSDEPGTNACAGVLPPDTANRGFWCINRGFTGQFITNSRVNDGFCDCCDGSDEYNSPSGTCADRCVEFGLEASKSTLELVRAIEDGAKARAEWIASAAQRRQTREQQLAEHELTLQATIASLETAKTSRDAAEAIETAERERLNAEKAKLQSAAEEKANADAAIKQQIEAAVAAAVAASNIAGATPESIEAANAPIQPAADAPPAAAAFPYPAEYAAPPGTGAAAPAAAAEPEKFPYPAEYAAPPAPPAAPAAAVESPHASDDFDDDDWEPTNGLEDEAEDEADEQKAKKKPASAAAAAPAAVPDPEYKDPDTTTATTATPTTAAAAGATVAASTDSAAEWYALCRSIVDSLTAYFLISDQQLIAAAADIITFLQPKPKTAAETLRDEVRSLESKKRDTESAISGVKSKLSADYGPDGVYSEFDGKCFEWKQRQYTYVVCPFDKADQREGGSNTNLGKWSGFDHPTAATAATAGTAAVDPVMKFSGGAKCWNGPERSITVTLKCGAANVLSAVEEPNKCVYTAVLRTPAVCDAAEAVRLRAELDAMLSGTA